MASYIIRLGASIAAGPTVILTGWPMLSGFHRMPDAGRFVRLMHLFGLGMAGMLLFLWRGSWQALQDDLGRPGMATARRCWWIMTGFGLAAFPAAISAYFE